MGGGRSKLRLKTILAQLKLKVGLILVKKTKFWIPLPIFSYSLLLIFFLKYTFAPSLLHSQLCCLCHNCQNKLWLTWAKLSSDSGWKLASVVLLGYRSESIGEGDVFKNWSLQKVQSSRLIYSKKNSSKLKSLKIKVFTNWILQKLISSKLKGLKNWRLDNKKIRFSKTKVLKKINSSKM